jgi:hypothetical protein
MARSEGDSERIDEVRRILERARRELESLDERGRERDDERDER